MSFALLATSLDLGEATFLTIMGQARLPTQRLWRSHFGTSDAGFFSRL